MLTNSRFLLVKFQMDYVLDHRESNKRMKALKTVPEDMNSAYTDVIQRIKQSSFREDKDLAMRIFLWLSRTHRPLLMDELLAALAIHSNDDSSDDDDDDSDEVIDSDVLHPDEVIECCKSLVLFEES